MRPPNVRQTVEAMQVDTIAKATANAGAKHRTTLVAPRAKLFQRIHALAILVVPFVGTIAAVAIAARRGLAPFDAALLIVMYFLTVTGITVGFHRLLTHRAFQAGTATKAALTVLGSMAAQGPPIYWVSNHRLHHQYSDLPGDPHSPYFDGPKPLSGWRGLWHAHVSWTFHHDLTNPIVFAKDLLRDPLLGQLNRLYYLWVSLGLALPALAGGIYAQSWSGALTGFLWGGLIRLFLTYHATNSINSLTHAFCSRPFNTREHSRNNLWLIVPTVGEAWHNNHHAFPTSAIFGLNWRQLDLGGLVVLALERARLIWGVNRTTPQMIERRRRRDEQQETALRSADRGRG